MNGKRAREIRKLTKTKVGKDYKPDLRVGKETSKMIYKEAPLSGEVKAEQVKMITVVNVAKYQYRQAKKKLKDVKIPYNKSKQELVEKEDE